MLIWALTSALLEKLTGLSAGVHVADSLVTSGTSIWALRFSR